MSLIPWRNKGIQKATEPMESTITQLRAEMEDLFQRFFGERFGLPHLASPSAGTLWGPSVDVSESGNDVAVKLEVPGVDPKDIEIDLSGNILTVRGEKKVEKEEKKRDYAYVERSFGSFNRSIPLPGSVDPEKVTATHKDGILTVTITKREEAKPKRITVRQA